MNYFLIAWALCTPAVFLYFITKAGWYGNQYDEWGKFWFKYRNSILAVMVFWAIFYAFLGMSTSLLFVATP